MKYIISCLFIVSLVGCTSEPQSKVYLEETKLKNERIKIQYEACIKLGGVPIHSAWQEGIGSCNFPAAVRR